MDEGTTVNQFMNVIIQRLDAGYNLLERDVIWLFSSLVVVQITLSGIYWALGAGQEAIGELLRRILVIGLVLYLIQIFPVFVDTIADTGIELGLKAGGSTITAAQVRDPGTVATLGWTSSLMIWEEIKNLVGPFDTYINIYEILMLFGAGLIVLLSFFAIAFQMFFALVALKLGSLVVYVLLPFAVFPGTAMIAERPLGWLVTSAVRLMLITIVVSVSFALFTDLTVNSPDPVQIREAVGIAAGSVILFIFSWQASCLAQDIGSGIPSFGFGSALATIDGGTAVGIAAGRVVSQGGRALRSSRTAPVDAVRAATKAPSPSALSGSKPPTVSGHNGKDGKS